MNYKSIHRAKRRGHVGVVQSSYFTLFTRRVKSDKKGATFCSANTGLFNNDRWIKGNEDPISGQLLLSGKYTRL